jgi:UDP-N-acetylglucosamine 4,6-dehydratase/5-epimerase|tara:strand:- start:70 stop:1086 length:1017 start_codon:yes stop_codon:yes gene_type:complete
MKFLKDKTLMVTGGTGSFGSTIIKSLLNNNLKEIRIFSRDEKKQEDMRLLYKNSKIKFYIGDVRTFDSVNQAMRGVDYVFHAAALKQVPSCEFYPMEAVRTNILGTENVLNAAFENKVKRVIVLSTDKAVYPINAMGISKAMMEKLIIAKANLRGNNKTILCATRYGNVMGSRGSVIPLFINLIKQGKPLTITDPQMTRFMMSLEDSVNLVLYAFKHAKQGEIFVQKAPAATVADLAKVMNEIFGKKEKVQIIGTRHGEKLFESLLSREEMIRAKDMGRFYCIPSDIRDLNHAKYFIEGQKSISQSEDYTSHNTERLNVKQLKKLIMGLEFVRKEIDA